MALTKVRSQTAGSIAGLRGAGAGSVSLLREATVRLGREPNHYIDFLANRALWSKVDVGEIDDIPNFSGTLDLSADGHLANAAADQLIITSPAITYPCTIWLEAKREADSGAVQLLVQADDGTAANRAWLQLSSTDLVAAAMNNTSVSQGNVTSGTAIAVNDIFKAAGVFATGNVNSASRGSLGTVATGGTVPASPPSALRISGAITATNNVSRVWYRRLAIFNAVIGNEGLASMTVA